MARLPAVQEEDICAARTEFQCGANACQPRSGDYHVPEIHGLILLLRELMCLLCGGSARQRLFGKVIFAPHQLGEHNQPLGRRAYVVGRVARDQGKLRVRGLVKNAYIVRHDDLFPGHFVAEDLSFAANLNFIAFGEFVNVAKERVTMSADHRIAGLTGSRRVLNVSRSLRQVPARYAFYDNCVEVDFGNYHAGQQVISRKLRRAGDVHQRRLVLPLSFELLLAAIHAPILAANVPKQRDSYEHQQEGEVSALKQS